MSQPPSDAPPASAPPTVFRLHALPWDLQASANSVQAAEQVAAAEPAAQPLPAPVALPKDYCPTPESAHALYQLQLENFAGPLDLLLFLIRRHELSIFDIPISFICARYVDCLQQ